uniref:Cytidyltransferase-like domain-containing protein n=1 Tax=Rhodosorus marinus TaxID=101924 RepID=A0A7S2Z913_9RHOD|mmetsp:Transcript_10599/g.44177  ORF Transcript_10599/g.44177 Transcript_10599/m.44177 type:complete len:429 (+) Transcript_10599:1376-2662(+)|eukprot:CAMPEP_0113954064 /NCGR_PEP_ID=MMETSP0011_2-20120614/242_1 /TAXON_ID=101924 /ORGANISM="Rhodosorus marinus" /LENGTH=428 /DNA_ID=CAMNT_0000962945 /DNA_START=236 /DNA_END=1522 /DNA_ORIENTATION=- /assembly_acc=CAM_ASM_000156
MLAFGSGAPLRMGYEAKGEVRDFIQRLHSDRSTKLVLATTGAGSRVLAWLLNEPGASTTILEGIVPYNRRALENLLRPARTKVGAGTVNQEMSALMAEACYHRGQEYLQEGLDVSKGPPPQYRLLGIGATAAISTTRERKGTNRFWVSVATKEAIHSYGSVLCKGTRTRAEEDELVSRAILFAMERSLQEGKESGRLMTIGLDTSEKLEHLEASRDPGTLVTKFLKGEMRVDSVLIDKDGVTASEHMQFRGLVLPGSFNPLHIGHRKLVDAAKRISGEQHVAYELGVVNADKGRLSADETLRRVEQFRGESQVILTMKPLVVEKMSILPGCSFVAGYDTAVRILNPAYYAGGLEEMIHELSEKASVGSRIFVAGRTEQLRNGESKFLTLRDLDVPNELNGMFVEIPEALFREDISSTQIRAQRSEADA